MRDARALFVLGACGAALSAFGSVVTVNVNGGADFTDIQSAIDSLTAGGRIVVEPGEYVIQEPLSFKGQAIRLESGAGPASTTIRMAEQAVSPERRSVVVFENGEDSSACISGFTLTGGRGTRVGNATHGGGIFCDHASPLITDCRIVLNTADRGGGMAGVVASPMLLDCTIAMNAAAMGGGLYLEGGTPDVSSCTVRRNRGESGGGAYLVGEATLSCCSFIGNMAVSKGGGLECVEGSSLRCCVIAGNRAELGAGLSTEGPSASTAVVSCTISGNARDGVDCADGGALPALVSCIVWPESSCGSFRHCLTDRDPRVVRPGMFDFNRFENVSLGGAAVALPDFVVEEPDFALRPDSPAIDAGTSEGTPRGDVRSVPRIDDPYTPDRGSGPVSYFDIGAYEYTTCRLWLEEELCRDDRHEVTVVARWATTEMQGLHWGLCHDPEDAAIGACAGTRLPSPLGGNPCDGGAAEGCDEDPPVCPCPEVMCPDDVLTSVWGERPVSFNRIAIYDRGITQQVLVDVMAAYSIPARERFELMRIAFTRKAPEARLEFCDSLGEPPVPLVFVDRGQALPPLAEGLTLAAKIFRRGDANASGALDIADAIFTLSYLFAKEAHPSCRDAADANDDGALDIADAIATLNCLFGAGNPLPAPFGECGLDPTIDDWGCGSYAPCDGR